MDPRPNLTHSSSGIRMPASNMESATMVLSVSASAMFLVATLVVMSVMWPSSFVFRFRSGSPSAISRIQLAMLLRAHGSVHLLMSAAVSFEGVNFRRLPLGSVIISYVMDEGVPVSYPPSYVLPGWPVDCCWCLSAFFLSSAASVLDRPGISTDGVLLWLDRETDLSTGGAGGAGGGAGRGAARGGGPGGGGPRPG